MSRTPLEVLESIRLEMAKIRALHKEHTELYILNKTKYDVLSTNFILKVAEGKSMAEKEREAKNQFEEDYVTYKRDKARTEGLDREFRNLDAQRSILQTRIANEK
jgi:hypothetical protein